MPRNVEATRHLPIISSRALFDVKEHIRGRAQGCNVVAKVCKRSFTPNSKITFSKNDYARLVKELKILVFFADVTGKEPCHY